MVLESENYQPIPRHPSWFYSLKNFLSFFFRGERKWKERGEGKQNGKISLNLLWKNSLKKVKIRLTNAKGKFKINWNQVLQNSLLIWGKTSLSRYDWVKISTNCYFKNIQTCKEIWGEVKEKQELYTSNFPTLWYNLLNRANMLLYVAFQNLIIRLKSKIRWKFIRDN